MQTPASSGLDPESLTKKPPRLVRHESEGHFDNFRWHLHNQPSIDRKCARTSLPAWLGQYFHPTHVKLERNDGVVKFWGSRAHRKQRYASVSPKTEKTRRKEWFVGKLASMGRLEYWNISWWVAQTFTWGSVIWCINGFAAFLPFCNSHVEPSLDLTGWTAFIGATVFEVGSVLGVSEALNRRDAVVFSDEATGKTADDNSHEHEPPRSPTEKGTAQVYIEAVNSVPKSDQSPRRKKWVWLPTNAKYWHEMGFLAAFFQLLGATIFWISGFTALPSILTVLSKNQGHLDGAFWTPQVVGGTGFIISSIFIMLEEQRIWWQPRLVSLGWQIGVWNFIGAIGFTLCGGLGYSTNSGAQYESSLATFWGSWAFLIASVLQWYECVNAV